ncbi:MAG: ABC transporter transmembrane domain-containing protein [Pseudomonadota bacterium]
MAKADAHLDADRPLEKKLLRYVWSHTRSEQLWILFVIIASMPTYFMVLDLPVRIINQPIQGDGFDSVGATKTFMEIGLSAPSFLGGGSVTFFPGVELERWPYLIALSSLFLALVCVNGLFKFYINTYKGRLGERMLRRMRFQLTDRVLRFPFGHFKRVKGSEIASMVKDEVEPFGEFIGDAFVQPVYLGGQALVAFIFILNQSFWLGMIAVAIIAFQVTIIPYLRRRVLELGRMRQLTARLLSGRIGEIVDGIAAVHVNDTSNYERAELSSRLGQIFFIRYELYQRKFFIKFLNNFLAQLTPFLFYVVGGYFAIRGSLNVGQLLGVINAYKDLPAPINGLIMWDQKRTDIDIKYAQIVEQFNVKGMMNAEVQAVSDAPVAPLQGTLQSANVQVLDDSGSILVEDADFRMDVRDRVAVLGSIGSGSGAMANTLAGLNEPSSGRLTLNGSNLLDLPQYVRGRRLAYFSSDSYLPQTSVLEALLYVNKHVPLRKRPDTLPPLDRHPKHRSEVIASGNMLLDIYDGWIDYEAMGVSNTTELFEKTKSILDVVELTETVNELAMRQQLDPTTNQTLCDQLLDMRLKLRERINGSPMAKLVEVWDWNTYNKQATLAENLLFGTAVNGADLEAERLVQNAYLRSVLAEDGLDRALFDMGVELAETAIELFADLSPDNPFFEQLNFMSPEQLEAYPPILARAKQNGFAGVTDADRDLLLVLPFGYIEERNRLRLLDDGFADRILAARHRFHANLPTEMAENINVYKLERYNALESIQDNILFGRVAQGTSNASDQVQTAIRELLVEEGLSDALFKVGLDFDMGTGGKRLSENQRQRINLARALMKNPDLMIINRGLNALDSRAEKRIVKRVAELAKGTETTPPFGLFWVLSTPALAAEFDKVVVFQRQRVVETGTPDELAEAEGTYASLVS